MRAADTTRVEINPNAPAKAAFFSAVLPGLGQAYNKKYWKIPIVYLGLGIGIYSYTWNQEKYHNFRDEYKRRLDGTANPNHPIYGGKSDDWVIRGQKFHQRNRDLSALITAGIYILNIVDAVVDAHLYDQKKDPDLAIKPTIIYDDLGVANGKAGLSLSFRF